MTTFQAIVYAIVHGFTQFLPLDPNAHQVLISYLLGWPLPADAFSAALSLGSFLALFITFRHEWASIIASFLKVILFRKKPMTLDERLPFFLVLTTLPAVLLWTYGRDWISPYLSDPLWCTLGLAVTGLLLGWTDSRSKRTKGMFDWTWVDCTLIGLGQLSILVPGGGLLLGSLLIMSMRNYRRDAAAKLAFYCAGPFMLISAYAQVREMHFHTPAPMPDLSWFTWVTTVVVTFFCGTLAIGGFLKQMQRKGLFEQMVYRVCVALGIGIMAWWRFRS